MELVEKYTEMKRSANVASFLSNKRNIIKDKHGLLLER